MGEKITLSGIPVSHMYLLGDHQMFYLTGCNSSSNLRIWWMCPTCWSAPTHSAASACGCDWVDCFWAAGGCGLLSPRLPELELDSHPQQQRCRHSDPALVVWGPSPGSHILAGSLGNLMSGQFGHVELNRSTQCNALHFWQSSWEVVDAE